MVEEKLLTVRDVSHVLNISESEVVRFTNEGKIPAYKIAGEVLRYKRSQIEKIRKELVSSGRMKESTYTFFGRLSDFFYYNDFYILAVILVIVMLAFIFR